MMINTDVALKIWNYKFCSLSQSDWLRLFLSQTFSHINTPTISAHLFFMPTPPMKMEQCVLKHRHTKFRHLGTTQTKEYNILQFWLKFDKTDT